MKVKNVIRLDSVPLNRTFFTEEGYLIDSPILTTTGIFEYGNSDGSVRRELRLPEEVFSADSLASYQAKPVIVSHDAGLVNKDNVHDNEIGTILSEGYRDGDNVRAKIVIHDTDEMKNSGLKELSLGYNLDLDETPGTWNGMHYDAIQRNIRINHLALVREARAGEKARLNIDSRDKKGAKLMSKMRKTRRTDSVLSPDELKAAIEEYKAKYAKVENSDEDKEEVVIPEEKVMEEVKEEKVERPDEEDVKKVEEMKETIDRQDDDIQSLLDIIDSLLAERDFKDSENTDEEVIEEEEEVKEDAEDNPEEEVVEEEEIVEDEDEFVDEEEMKEDEDEEEIIEEEELDKEDECGDEDKMNKDSIDAIVRERVKVLRAGDKLNLDGMEHISLRTAKKRVIKAVRPAMNLDGKNDAYINAAFDMAYDYVQKKTVKDTKYQKKQMFNKDSKAVMNKKSSAEDARNRMMNRHMNRNKEGK